MVAYLAVALRDRAVRMGVGVAPSTSSARASRSASSCCRSCCSPATAGRSRSPSSPSPASPRATVWKLGPVVGLVGGVVIAAAVGALVALPALQDARPLPGPRHDGLRPVHRGEPLRRQPVVPADAAVLARQRDRRPLPRARRRHRRSSWPWPSCSRSWSCCSPSSATARSVAACRPCATRRRPASRSASTSRPRSSRSFALSAGIAGLGGALLADVEVLERRRERLRPAAWTAPRARARAGRGGQRHHDRVRTDLRRRSSS